MLTFKPENVDRKLRQTKRPRRYTTIYAEPIVHIATPVFTPNITSIMLHHSLRRTNRSHCNVSIHTKSDAHNTIPLYTPNNMFTYLHQYLRRTRNSHPHIKSIAALLKQIELVGNQIESSTKRSAVSLWSI